MMSLVGEMSVEADVAEVVRENIAEDSAEMDAKVTAIMHLQQLQHKQEVMQLLEAHPVTNADTEFRMQLEELVRDHLNTCIALASCSSNHDNCSHSPPFGLLGDTSDSHHHLLEHSAEQCHHHHHHHHQYHLVVENEEEGDDQDEKPAQEPGDNTDTTNVPHVLLRPQTGILGRWDERQGTEPTLRERQVREAELLALSSLHTVSTLDASFLQGSPSPRAESSVERPQRLSPLVQMWRELEGEQGDRETSQLSDRIRTRGGETGVLHTGREFERDHQADTQRPEDECDQRRTAEATEIGVVMLNSISQSNQGSEYEISDAVGSVGVEPLADIEPSTQETSISINSQLMGGSQTEMHELEGERERVRHIVRRWMRQSGVPNSEATENVQPRSRDEWLAEGEQERVRQMAREWVQVSNIEARPRPSQRQAVDPLNMVRQQTGKEVSSSGDLGLTQQNCMSWDDEHQREMVSELLMRSEQERQRELEGISGHHIVSEFAHRSHLQSFLRGRFLHSGVGADVERPPSSAAGEIGQLRQRQAVSGLREGFRFRLETIVRSQSNPGLNDGQRRRWQENPNIVLPGNTSEAIPVGLAGYDRLAPQRAQWTHQLQSVEAATAYNMELRELLARQSVTTMLASEFRDRLDQLIRSFMHTQGRTPHPWNLSRPRQPTPPTQQEQILQQGLEGPRRADGTQAARLVIPPPPLPPPHPLWHPQPMVLQQGTPVTWTCPAPQRAAEMEWETTSRALRADVNELQRSMNEMIDMMQASIQMQFDLQRSVRQEISGALQRMYIGKEVPEEALDGSKWTSVKKGVCCICCDKQIDCLLYRCGHMCTCVMCANELHKNCGRCPMCRASIVEVVRAFTIT